MKKFENYLLIFAALKELKDEKVKLGQGGLYSNEIFLLLS